MRELSSREEIVDYFGTVLRERLLPTGRVTWIPNTQYLPSTGRRHVLRSLASGVDTEVRALRLVDATTADVRIPATHAAGYRTEKGVRHVPVNELPDVEPEHNRFTIIGGGKTGMDACLWLLEAGVEPERIRWIVPNDFWVIPRETVDSYVAMLRNTIAAFEQIVDSNTMDELFEGLERRGVLMRLDRQRPPSAYHCANVSRAELAQLQRIKDVVRLGRLVSIETDRLLLEDGTIAAMQDTLYVNCSASAFQPQPSRPIFEPGRINLQWVRWCQPLFSAALIGFVESRLDDDARRNALCTPLPPPRTPEDWLRMWRTTLVNMRRWRNEPSLANWIAHCRLDSLASLRRMDEHAERRDHLLVDLTEASMHVVEAIDRLLPSTDSET